MVSDIPSGTGKSLTFFLQCIVCIWIAKLSLQSTCKLIKYFEAFFFITKHKKTLLKPEGGDGPGLLVETTDVSPATAAEKSEGAEESKPETGTAENSKPEAGTAEKSAPEAAAGAGEPRCEGACCRRKRSPASIWLSVSRRSSSSPLVGSASRACVSGGRSTPVPFPAANTDKRQVFVHFILRIGWFLVSGTVSRDKEFF